LASWLNGQADRLLERSTWGRYPLGFRVLAALVCWLLGVAAGGLTLVILKAPRTVGIIVTVTIAVWFSVLLAANVTGSRSLLRITIWCMIPIFGLLPIALAFASG
jgi:hypothetical protein